MDKLERKSQDKKQKTDYDVRETREKLEEGDKVLTMLDINKDGREEEKLEAVFESEEEDEMEDKPLIGILPPEMLENILKYLDVKSLLTSRRVSKIWKEHAGKLLKSRDNVETTFRETRDGIFMAKGDKSSLENFTQWFQDSKEPPVNTRFYFDNFYPSVFEDACWIEFISVFGQQIKSLRLVICEFENFDDELPGFIEKLGNLLFHQLPNLQEFGLQLPNFMDTSDIPNIQLFPTEMCQLVHLKVIYLDCSTFFDYPEIATDLLVAAVNLETIQPFFQTDEFHQDIEAFQFLQSLGKLHCLKHAVIRLNDEFMSNIHENPSAPLNFKLQTLILNFGPCYVAETFLPDASVFLSNLFESSKDTLKELQMNPIGFLPALEFPKFSKLTKFTTAYTIDREQFVVLPPGKNLTQVFPVLNNLVVLCHVPLAQFFPEIESIPSYPNLKTLKLKGCEITKKDVVRISQVCTNLKEFGIYRHYCGISFKNFHKVAEAIWTRLTKLESLILQIDVTSPGNSFPSIDSYFTGFARRDCVRLDSVIKNKRGAQSTSKWVPERKYPSILDLKDLRKLQVYFDRQYSRSGRHNQERSFLSEEYAFKLMKNLHYEIHE